MPTRRSPAGEPDPFEEFSRPLLPTAEALHDHLKPQRLVAGHQWIDRMSWSDPDTATNLVRLGGDIETRNRGRSRRRLQRGHEHPTVVDLPAPFAEKAKDLALPHIEVDAIDYGEITKASNQAMGDDVSREKISSGHRGRLSEPRHNPCGTGDVALRAGPDIVRIAAGSQLISLSALCFWNSTSLSC